MSGCAEFDRATFTDLINEHEVKNPTRDAIFDLLDFSCKNALKIVSGKNSASFLYKVATRKGSATLFYCDSYGSVTIPLSNFPELKPAAVNQFVQRLTSLSQGFEYISRLQDRRTKQSFSVSETLVDPFIMSGFKGAVLKLQATIGQ